MHSSYATAGVGCIVNAAGNDSVTNLDEHLHFDSLAYQHVGVHGRANEYVDSEGSTDRHANIGSDYNSDLDPSVDGTPHSHVHSADSDKGTNATCSGTAATIAFGRKNRFALHT
jgi:hypothetical protein